MEDGLKINAKQTTSLQDMEERLNHLSGMLEVLGHDQKSQLQNKSQLFHDRISLLEQQSSSFQKKLEVQETQMQAIEKKLDEQSKYLKKVLKGLKSISDTQNRTPYDDAMLQYKKGKYSKARELLLELESDGSIKGKQRARVLHNLGMIGSISKKHDQALIYLSKLFTEFPKSTYNINGLFVLGKSFKELGDQAKANQTFKELIKRYPKTKEAKKAEKLIK